MSTIQNHTNDLIQSVKEVFSEAISQGKSFTIPPYQRGYKWNRGNVVKLLDDLRNFESGNASNPQSFYCIQNITIVPLADDTGWNVVDGQQRLTTLFILLSFLRKKYNKSTSLDFFCSPECLKYNVRERTGAYLQNNIFCGNIWDDDIEPDEAELKDKWYILDVAKGIKDWFDKDGNSLSIDTVTDRLKLIVNEMSNKTVSEEEIFAGLNGGKVDLDGTDLVRAELITRSAKEKYQNALAPKVKEFRTRIAIELDEMSLWWGQKEQSIYFKQFLPEKFNDNVFNHDTHPLGLLYKLYFIIYHNEAESFGIEFFENGRKLNGEPGDDHWKLYESIMSLHKILKMWFSDTILYHWIGYIMFRFKGQSLDSDLQKTWSINKEYASIGFNLIWRIWESSPSKYDFIGKLIALAKSQMIRDGQPLVNYIRDVKRQWYGVNPQGITDVLVLMDVMKCTGLYRDLWKDEDKNKVEALTIAELSAGKLRLPASYFTKYRENFEHIRSCAPNQEEGKEERSKAKWESHIASLYRDTETTSDEYKMKSALLAILNSYVKDELDDATINKLNQEMNKFGQHSIGNMALLDEHVNKSYGNDPFQKKIQRIFTEYMNDAWYIRPYTMIVFEHKINDPDRAWRWTQQNIKENAQNIANNIERLIKYEL